MCETVKCRLQQQWQQFVSSFISCVVGKCLRKCDDENHLLVRCMLIACGGLNWIANKITLNGHHRQRSLGSENDDYTFRKNASTQVVFAPSLNLKMSISSVRSSIITYLLIVLLTPLLFEFRAWLWHCPLYCERWNEAYHCSVASRQAPTICLFAMNQFFGWCFNFHYDHHVRNSHYVSGE